MFNMESYDFEERQSRSYPKAYTRKGVSIMIEKTLSQLGKQLDRRVKIPTAIIVCAVLISFIVGLLTGTLIANIVNSKKLKAVSSDEDFDADEYLKDLDLSEFDDEE